MQFSEISHLFYKILSNSYTTYYGNDYHNERIRSGQAILYIAFVDEKLVAVSYVKRNRRRGGTAVFPIKYRKIGLAKKLVEMSLDDFPEQYSILSINHDYSHKMLSLLIKVGFRKASSIEELKNIIGEEFHLLSEFRDINGYLVFDRESDKREVKRQSLTLLHTFKYGR